VGSPAWTSPHLDGSLFGQPLVGGSLVYVATENDTVYALSASTGAVAWSAHVGTPFNPSVVPSECGDIRPTVGITSTPVIDVVRSEIFVVADEASGNTAAHHLIGLDLATGHVQLDEIIDPSGSDPAFQLQRVSLALTAGRVIVGFGGNAGDCGSYHGLVVSAPEDGSTPAVFTVASLTGDRQGAVWMGGGAPVIDGQGNVWVSTGNSAHVHAGDAYDDSDGVLELSPTMQLLGFFAPTTWYSDNAYDADFSTPPTLLDNGLVLAMGKSSIGYVLNQASLGGIGGQLTSTPACFGRGASAHVGNVVYQGCGGGVGAFRVGANPASLQELWSSTSGGGGSPIVAGGLVWNVSSGGRLSAMDPTSGSVVESTSIGSEATSFPSPSTGDGLLLAPSTDQVHAFASLPPTSGGGYWLTASDGGIFSFGDAGFFGSQGGKPLNRPVVGMAATPSGKGYWEVASDGGIFSFGDANFFGSEGGKRLNAPIVGMASTPDGKGYWEVASDGGIFTFGDAGFFGSQGGKPLNRPVVGMAATGDGNGYWLTASDGGIFSFGDANFFGSEGGKPLNAPIVGMASSASQGGYWLTASDGGIFAFGNAGFFGSQGGKALNAPIVGMAATPDRNGYQLTASDGGIFAFGNAGFFGSQGGSPLNAPIVGIAATPG
jgi:outer membrane protein assembly factor BamB